MGVGGIEGRGPAPLGGGGYVPGGGGCMYACGAEKKYEVLLEHFKRRSGAYVAFVPCQASTSLCDAQR